MILLCTRRDSNPYRRYRKPKFYPLNYGCLGSGCKYRRIFKKVAIVLRQFLSIILSTHAEGLVYNCFSNSQSCTSFK